MPKFTPRVRKQAALRRAATVTTAPGPADSNALEMLPVSRDERETRRKQLRDEIRAQQPESKASSKKRKRLDKYIDTKLKKEENLDLIKKLAESKVDTTLFRSSKKLGRVSESSRERLGRALREQRAGIAADTGADILYERQVLDDNDEEDISEHVKFIPVRTPSAVSVSATASIPKLAANSTTPNVSFGSGLKRPLETDESGQPVVTKRQRRKGRPTYVQLLPRPVQELDEEWGGFRSEAEDTDDSMPDDGNSDSLSDVSDTASDNLDAGSSVESGTETEDSSEESLDDEACEGINTQAKEQASSFKAWATQQRNEALGFTPSSAIDLLSLEHTMEISKAPDQSTKPSDNSVTSQQNGPVAVSTVPTVVPSSVRNVYNVPVTRSETIEKARLALPVVAEEQKIMEAIRNNDCIIVWGATGSGKTTQIPQFLFEAGYGSPQSPTPGLIGVTQPRRVAAVSMAKRVATELGEFHDKVGYQIRFDSAVGPKTAIKFMTDGVLSREISQDFMLSKYSAIVLDEAHERSVNTDLLMGMLSRIVDTRADLAKTSTRYKSLKLIIMSATLSTAEITSNTFLFRKGPPPVVKVEGRQHPVTVHFARRTQRDYLEEAFGKISRGHKKLPAGGFLVFLTGQNEIQALAKRLKAAFSSTDGSWKSNKDVRISAAEASVEDEDVELGGHSHAHNNDEDDSESDSEILGVDNDEDKEFDIGDDPVELMNIHVLPLYSQLPTDQQMRIFQDPPEGSRLIVLATNVAETSLTTPGIRYVFDCGRAKQKNYSVTTGVQSFEVGWISKASASQRAGRAGRTGPGHCYRLYSSAVYERDFAEFGVPEITRVPLEGVVLQLKAMGIPNIVSFPFPTPPNRQSMQKAERLLEYLGAISGGKVTTVGNQLSMYPLSPRLSRALCQAQIEGVIDHAIGLVSALSIPDVFIPESQLDIIEPPPLDEDKPWSEADNIAALAREKRRKEYNAFHANASRNDRSSDATKLLTTVCDFTNATTEDELHPFRQFTRTKALAEIVQLRRQLSLIVATHRPGTASADPAAQMQPPTAKLAKTLRGIVAAGFVDQVAIRADLSPTPPESVRKPKRATDVPYITLFPSTASNTEDTTPYDKNDPAVAARLKYVYIHPSSLLAHCAMDKLPQFLIYSHLSRGTPSQISGPSLPPRTRIHPLAPTTAEQLTLLARGTPLLEDGKPLGKIEVLERDDRGRERRMVLVMPFLKGEGGDAEWPLPPAKSVVQLRVPGKGWVSEM